MFKLLALISIVFCSNIAFADTVLEKNLGEPELVGAGGYKAMFWKIYDAELYSNDGEYSFRQPFALKLKYSRDLRGEVIADKSIELIRRQGIEDEIILAAWHRQLKDIFPDVEDGTEIIGVHKIGVGAVFYADGEEVGTLKDSKLCESFFGIWLAEDTVAPKLREKLLGLASN